MGVCRFALMRIVIAALPCCLSSVNVTAQLFTHDFVHVVACCMLHVAAAAVPARASCCLSQSLSLPFAIVFPVRLTMHNLVMDVACPCCSCCLPIYDVVCGEVLMFFVMFFGIVSAPA